MERQKSEGKKGVDQPMEILLKEPDARAYVDSMQSNAGKLSLATTSTAISGQSEALEKFLSTYQNFLETLSAYRTVFTNDVWNVSNAVDTLTEADEAQSGQIDSLGAFSNLLVQP